MKNKEEIYDDEISGLMTQIIAICKREKIAMVASFSIPTPEDEHLVCFTALLELESKPPQALLDARDVLRPKEPPVMHMTITKGDGSKECIAFVG